MGRRAKVMKLDNFLMSFYHSHVLKESQIVWLMKMKRRGYLLSYDYLKVREWKSEAQKQHVICKDSEVYHQDITVMEL